MEDLIPGSICWFTRSSQGQQPSQKNPKRNAQQAPYCGKICAECILHAGFLPLGRKAGSLPMYEDPGACNACYKKVTPNGLTGSRTRSIGSHSSKAMKREDTDDELRRGHRRACQDSFEPPAIVHQLWLTYHGLCGAMLGVVWMWPVVFVSSSRPKLICRLVIPPGRPSSLRIGHDSTRTVLVRDELPYRVRSPDCLQSVETQLGAWTRIRRYPSFWHLHIVSNLALWDHGIVERRKLPKHRGCPRRHPAGARPVNRKPNE